MSQQRTASHLSTGGQPVRLQQITPAQNAVDARAATRIRDRAAKRLENLDAAAHRWLVAHSIAVLRISLGVVFLGFGALKFFPGVSPAEDLVKDTTSVLTFGLVPGSLALVGVAALECVIGGCLISGRGIRSAVYLLGIQLAGILSPLVLFAPRLFSGPHNAPTLEGQYVLKDVILVGATLVIAATLRGGTLTSPALSPATPAQPRRIEGLQDLKRAA